MAYEITKRQTTFWELRQAGHVVRVHFVGKEEFGFVETSAPSFSVVENHPLLMDYEFAWQNLYLVGKVAAADDVLGNMVHLIETRLEGWRPAMRYFNRFGGDRILRGGGGLLIAAPLPIIETCSGVLHDAGAQFSALSGRSPRWPRCAFIAGRNYVVAKYFRVEDVG